MNIIGQTEMITFGIMQNQTLLEGFTIVNQSSQEGRIYSPSLSLLAEQAYDLQQTEDGYLLYGDEAGCMYGLFDIADATKSKLPLPLGLHQPHVLRRGIKFNIPLDARTPSYSDSGDSAWQNIENMWDFAFWQKQIDLLARNKYNFISLWSLNPFPSMVVAEGFENASIDDVMRTKEPVQGSSLIGYGMYTVKHAKNLETLKKITIHEKITFWQKVMAYGRSRGIRFVIITWNVYPCVALQSEYGITEALDNPVTKLYYKQCTKAMVETYPLLYGIGVTAGERMGNFRDPHWDMKNDVRWIGETYGKGIQEALQGQTRDFRLIFRQHMCSVSDIQDILSPLKIPVEFSYKYSVAHMYSSPHPTFGDAFFASLPKEAKTWLTLRNDDMYMLPFGGIDFARTYLQGVARENVCGFMMGPDGYTEAIDYLATQPPFYKGYVFERQWLRMALWGRLAYDITLPNAHFEALIKEKTGEACAGDLLDAANILGDILPLVNQVHWNNLDFMGYTETASRLDYDHDTVHVGRGIVYQDLFDELLAKSQKNIGVLSVTDTCRLERFEEAVPNGIRTADEVAEEIHQKVALGKVALCKITPCSTQAKAMYEDLYDTMLLGTFYANKFQCALALRRLVDEMPSASYQTVLDKAQETYDAYASYCDRMSTRYQPQRLSRMNGLTVDLQVLKQQAYNDLIRIQNIVEAYIPFK